jgi:Uma2 family endonuclease
MATATATPPPKAVDRLYTIEDLLAMPDDGVERWLIRGRLREKDAEMTKRNRYHAAITARICQLIGDWIDKQPEPRGEVYGGEAGLYLRRNPDSAVGVDVLYMPPGSAAAQTDQTTMLEGVPVLAVEVLSPSNTMEEIHEKLDDYISVGVTLVWIVDPHLRTVTVIRPDEQPEMFNSTHTLDADPHMPGFRVPVLMLFRR